MLYQAYTRTIQTTRCNICRSHKSYNAIINSFSSALSLVNPFLGLASESDKINSVSLVMWLWAQVANAISIWLK